MGWEPVARKIAYTTHWIIGPKKTMVHVAKATCWEAKRGQSVSEINQE